MKLGIVITTYNRPEYLSQCLQSLQRATIPNGTRIIIVDDCSTDEQTLKLISGYHIQDGEVINVTNPVNSKISYSLRRGFNLAFERGCDVVMNLDSDTIVRKDFVYQLTSLWEKFPDRIITGFNCLTRNANGTERHVIVGKGEGYSFKKSVTGVNMMMSDPVYKKYMEPSLVATTPNGNWDHLTGIASMNDNKPTVCIIPSVVQHIGLRSSLGHGNTEPPDVAIDFEDDNKLNLPTVTLIGVTGTELPALIKAADVSTKHIQFASVKLLSSMPSADPRVIKIEPLKSIEAYTEFVVRKLADYIDTEHLLIIQPDGYVINPQSWSDEFLKYDYIGAPWNWYADKKVGNGGFSLRTKRLHEILKSDDVISEIYPEDHHICRTYRNYLEKYHHIKFAPEEIAVKFSVENFRLPAPMNKYSGSFGFHGYLTDFSGSNLEHVPYLLKNGNRVSVKPQIPLKPLAKKQAIIFSQPWGLGDVLFAMTLANDYINQGHEVLWPVYPQYVSIQKHFPQIKFSDWTKLKVDHNRKYIRDTAMGKVIPLRWSERIIGKDYRWVMRSKYDLLKKDFKRWRELTWQRDHELENKLFAILGISEGEKYNLINNNFRNDQTGKTDIQVNNYLRNIEVKAVPGFTLLDWGKVIEQAASIHTVSTSINYMIDVMDTTSDLHQYVRKPDEKDFVMTEYLWEKKYEYHF